MEAILPAPWRHLGRLAGFTNQKPARRTFSGYPPWVTILYARAGLASCAEGLLQSVAASLPPWAPINADWGRAGDGALAPVPITADEAVRIYQHWVRRWRIPQRFAQPDWSIVDLWVARQLFSQGMLPVQVRTILEFGSPQFPRRHGNPQDYLRRTLARAAFSRKASPPPVCSTTHTNPASFIRMP